MKKCIFKRTSKLNAILVSICLMTSCSTLDPKTGERQDPLEGFNRAMWHVNYNYLDPYILKPVAKSWKEYVPIPLRASITNVVNNLDEPVSFINSLLVWEPQKAGVHFTRFWLNSILGLGGIFNWADRIPSLKLQPNDQREFGDTLASYGVDTGVYVMVPAYGAATPRQDLGKIVDMAYSPATYLAWPISLSKFLIQNLNKRAEFLGKEALLRKSQDPYIMFREAYFQHLDYRMNGDKATPKIELKLSQSELDEIDS